MWRPLYVWVQITFDLNIDFQGLHYYNFTDKTGRPVLWNRFTKYKKGTVDKERSKRIYEIMEEKAGRNGWIMVGDGQDVVPENINVDLMYNMVDFLMKYYPSGIYLDIALDLPPFFAEIVNDIIAYLNPSLRKMARLYNSNQLMEVFHQVHIPAYKLSLMNKP